MASVAEPMNLGGRRPDLLSGTPRAHSIDRWIYVFTAASFIAIVLAGFVPSSLAKIAAVEAGERPPFPAIMHMHALLMGSFLLLLLAQTVLVATGRCALHKKLGIASLILAPAIVVVGFLLAFGSHQAVWGAALGGPSHVRPQMHQLGMMLDNILLLQIRVGFLFPILLGIGLMARNRDPGLHKRMMILSVAAALPAGIDRIPWLPTTLPDSPLATDFYTLLAISPMLLWDLIRNRWLHRAYGIWLGIALPFTIGVHILWDTPEWHAMARSLTGA